MSARVAGHRLGCIGRSLRTEHTFDVTGIVLCPRANAVELTLTTGAHDDLPAVTAGCENERGRVQWRVHQALAVPGKAASPR
ncbi:hypothetical protein AB0952_03520 [Streptomyces caniferus]|uniref:hypothetical protein n=1 Tax=Streptomyces caniferus TaxID=285557 RepID=UPI003452C53A